MAGSPYTSANAAQAIVKLVATEAVEALMANLVMGLLVNRNYENDLANFGDTVNIPIPPVLTANSLLEGGSVNLQNPTLGNAQIILNSHEEASFNIPDVTKAIVVPDLQKTILQPAIIAIAEKIETDLLALYPNFNVNAAVGSGSTSMDEARVDLAEQTLFNQKVPAKQDKFLVVSSSAYGALRQIPRFTEYFSAGPNAQPASVFNGAIAGGKIKDLNVFRSQLVAKPSTVSYNVAFARDAIALAVRRLPIPLPGTGAVAEFVELGGFGLRVIMSYQPNSLSQQFTVDVLYGCGVLRNSFGVQVLST